VDIESVRDRVNARLRTHVTDVAELINDISPQTHPLTEELAGLLDGGKRLRAAFCYWSWRAHGGESAGPGADSVIDVMAALELFQAAALFHDDVIDDSDVRRGRPTAHRSFAAQARELGAPAPDPFGVAAAILLGDLTLLLAQRRVRQRSRYPRARQPSDGYPGRLRAYANEVMAGQYLDILGQVADWTHDPLLAEQHALSVVRAKSARYSVEHPLAMGALLAGADPTAVTRIRAYGLPVGVAFQLRDDFLGVFGDPAVTGKPAGDDLREGKRTVLITRTYQLAETGDRTFIRDRLGAPDLSSAEIDRFRSIITSSGASDQVEALIAQHTATGLAALTEAPPLAEPGLGMLVELAAAATDRQV
jgi:geranylgeranyl diphosphate synthase type I